MPRLNTVMKTIFGILIFFSSTLAFAKLETPFYLGDWAQGCKIIGDDDVVKEFILFDSKIMDHIVIAYEEESCKTPYLIFTRQYQLNANQLSPEDKKINVEMSVVKVSYQTLSDEVSEALNLVAFCGFKDWETYKEKDVTGKTCQDYIAPKQGTSKKFQFSTKTKAELFLDSDPEPFYKLMP